MDDHNDIENPIVEFNPDDLEDDVVDSDGQKDGDDGYDWTPEGWDDDDEVFDDDGLDAIDFDQLVTSTEAKEVYREQMPEEPRPLHDDIDDELRSYIWEQLPGETDRQYAVFSAFRDTAPISRSLNGVARILLNQPERREAPRRWQLWYKEWDWPDRVRAFDQWKFRKTTDREIDKIAQAKEETYAIARTIKLRGAQTVTKMAGDPEKGVPPTELPPYLAPQWVRLGHQMELDTLGANQESGYNTSFADEMRVKVEVVFIEPPDFERRRTEALEIKEELTEEVADDE